MIVYAIIDLRSSLDHPLRDAIETFIRREDAERFIEEVHARLARELVAGRESDISCEGGHRKAI